MRSAETTPTRERPSPPTSSPGRIGDSPVRPDGVEKVQGEFTYSSDLWADGMLWGATLRSPHPRANIWSIDTSAAEAVPGVYAVLTHEDVPGRKTYGLEIPTSPSSPGRRFATRGRRSRWSPPTIPRRRGAQSRR